jgi:flagellar hook-basal body complex protein FliE
MSDMQINQVLAQIRAMSQQVYQPTAGPGAAGFAANLAQAGATSGASGAQAAVEGTGASGSDFSALLKRGIDQVNQSQQTATDVATQFERGAPGVDLPQVMIEVQKASVSFRALAEVRNRLVSVYQDIMSMQM